MATREEIDALLIGRLYGELGSADEAVLQKHLEANPDDRKALAGLTEARGQLKESRLLEQQQDPPQSLSALLMQEAARRAPKPASEGWFARFVQSFIAHPAMAAAATLVLVVGVAGTMYMKRGSQFAKETTTSSEAQRNADAMGLATGAPSVAEVDGTAPMQVAAGSSAPAEPLAVEQAKAEGAHGDVAMGVRLAEPSPDPAASTSRKGAVVQGQARGMEITAPAAEPKDLIEDQVIGTPERSYATKPTTKSPAKQAVTPSDEKADRRAATASDDDAPGAVGGAQAPPKADGYTYGSASSQTDTRRDDGKVAQTTGSVSTPKPAPPPPPAPVTATTPKSGAKKEASSTNERELDAAVSAAKQNKCDVADKYATSIANRDLDYYASQVEDNRELKHCKAVMKGAPRAAETQRAKRAQVKTSSESK